MKINQTLKSQFLTTTVLILYFIYWVSKKGLDPARIVGIATPGLINSESLKVKKHLTNRSTL